MRGQETAADLAYGTGAQAMPEPIVALVVIA